MLKFQKGVPVKETNKSFAKFPRFSLIQKIAPRFYETSHQASENVARIVKQAIIKKNSQGQTFVLGLATGSTPLRLYKQLIKLHKNGQLSFKNVVTFNLDEYYPIANNNPESYNYYMNVHLFNHIDIPKENINIPNGEIDRSEVTKFCADYQHKIKSYGGIDIQILGIGRTGHIGFNEPPSPINSITRLVYLHRITRKDAANNFQGIDNVPKAAITMGIQTIRKAKKILIMAWSQSKAHIVKTSIEQDFNPQVPSTFLHEHPDANFFLDRPAGELLTRFNTPWIIKGDIEDPIIPKSPYWILKMATWLSVKLNKTLLRLTYDDYQDNHLSQLVFECAKGVVEDLNLYCYKKIISKITGWPLGNKPIQNVELEIAFANLSKKATKAEKVLIFSPHPDDDVISMGGTIKKMIEQGHDVHVAYMTPGSNGVFDHEAQKYLYFLKDFTTDYFWNNSMNQDTSTITLYKNSIQATQNIFNDNLHEKHKDISHAIKKFIRKSQAKISVTSLGMNPDNVYSLELPFYGNHHTNRKKIGQKDYEIVESLMRLIQPTVIFAAGDLTDPHGTHRKCLDILLHIHHQQEERVKKDPSCEKLFPPNEKFFLYRGAWEQWTIPMSRLIVPISPKDVQDKFSSIIKHQSQRQNPLYPGDDKRPFWQRVQQRNRDTAKTLTQLGFPDYEACQCFVNINDLKNYCQI